MKHTPAHPAKRIKDTLHLVFGASADPASRREGQPAASA